MLPSTYLTGTELGHPFIKCLICGWTSFNPGDIEHKYCAVCKGFHQPPASLPMWTIYDHPSDYPEWYVARLSMTDQPTSIVLMAETIEELRAMLPPGLWREERHPQDDPVIVEIWY